MKSRLLVAAFGIPLALWVILFAPVWVMEVVIWLLSGIGAYELMKCINAHKNIRFSTAVAAALVLIVPSAFGEVFLIPAIMFCLIVHFAFAVWKAGEMKWCEVATAFFAITVIPYALSAFLRMTDAGFSRAYLLLPLIFSFASDSGAFFVGLAFGKHKLAPKVSPKKTVEGAIGGIVFCVLFFVIFGLIIEKSVGAHANYLVLAIGGVFISVVSQIGDLVMSLIKRKYGIKDYGKIFPGHGGVLDRCDSVLAVTIVMTIICTYFNMFN